MTEHGVPNVSIEVDPGAIRRLFICVVRQEKNLVVIDVDSCTKYTDIAIGGFGGFGEEHVHEIMIMPTEHTLHAHGTRTGPARIRIGGLDGDWNVGAPDSCRYSFSIVAWREQDERGRVVYDGRREDEEE